jgi:RNA polymerase sigma-70 factor (ECF subfamily)
MTTAQKRREWVLQALDEYEGRLLRYAARLLGGIVYLAGDAVQPAFVKLCVVGGPLAPRAQNRLAERDDHVAPWLFRVCRNRALDHLRQAGRERSLGASDDEQTDKAAWRLAGREPDPANVAETGELSGVLRELVDELPAAQRETIDLWCEGFAYRQIAEITSRKEGHVRVLVHRGLARLREHPQVRGWLTEKATNEMAEVLGPTGQPTSAQGAALGSGKKNRIFSPNGAK